MVGKDCCNYVKVGEIMKISIPAISRPNIPLPSKKRGNDVSMLRNFCNFAQLLLWLCVAAVFRNEILGL